MKLQQLHCICAVAQHDLNVSAAAKKLYTSQSSVSKQISMLEDELAVVLFVRNGRRFVQITEAGKAIVAIAEDVLRKMQRIKRIGEAFSKNKLEKQQNSQTHVFNLID